MNSHAKSGLRERLLRHKKPAGDSAAETEEAPKTGTDAAQETADAGEWAQIGAHMEQSEWGSFVMRRRVYEGTAIHGRYALNELIGQSDRLSILLAPPGGQKADTVGMGRRSLPQNKLLYLDTETTGLGIGAGNVPFMIGIGFYDGDSFFVEQMFIRHPGEELAMLNYLQKKLEEHPYLVSYNGKTFDWPLIKNRYILNRMPSEPEVAGHLDFLYPSRSLWKHTLPSCRLGKVEEERLHVVRDNDVPGSLAPALYFQYLAERNVSVMEGVFVHNELDILSLAGLSIHFAGVLNGKSNLAEMAFEELFRLGLWFDKLEMDLLADDALELLTDRLYESAEEEAADYLLPLAQVYKQRRMFVEACRLWTLYVERKGDRSTASAEPFIELSMYYEHREKKVDLALQYAEQALHKAWQRQSLRRSYGINGGRTGGRRAGVSKKDTKQLEEVAALEKRLQRLQHKSKKAVNQTANQAKQRASSGKDSLQGAAKIKPKATGRNQMNANYMMDNLI